MLRIDRTTKKFVALAPKTLAEVKLLERSDLQSMIRSSFEAFTAEIGEALLLIGEEVSPSDLCSDRIDLLAMDPEGTAVVIEIKRGSNRLQLLQALSYAGMLSRWDADQFIAERAKFAGTEAVETNDEIVEFLSSRAEGIGQKQRIILLAEGFDYEVLFTAEWLHEKYGVDIRCYRFLLSTEADNEFASCTRVFPPPELSQFALARKRVPNGFEAGPPLNWDEALAKCNNPDIADFFRLQLKANRDCDIQRPALKFKIDGRNAWWVSLRKDRAYVWQEGRFPSDVEFWKNQVSDGESVQAVEQGTKLRFYLKTGKDCSAFLAGTTLHRPAVASRRNRESSDEEDAFPQDTGEAEIR